MIEDDDDRHVPGTGKWRQPGASHKAWRCLDIEDLEEPCHVCEMCEVQIVRYVHTIFHPNYGALKVGCICAGYMEQDLVGARQREASFKQRLSRRANWLRPAGAHHGTATNSSTRRTVLTSSSSRTATHGARASSIKRRAISGFRNGLCKLECRQARRLRRNRSLQGAPGGSAMIHTCEPHRGAGNERKR
jgi:hypothetical protein